LTLLFFLGFEKRREEAAGLGNISFGQRPALEGYSLQFLNHAISTVATLPIICYVLYVADSETSEFFGTRAVFLLTVFVLYGMFHYLGLILTHQTGGNPAAILLSNRHILLACIGWGLTWAAIILSKQV